MAITKTQLFTTHSKHIHRLVIVRPHIHDKKCGEGRGDDNADDDAYYAYYNSFR